jgi:hypothetical protein
VLKCFYVRHEKTFNALNTRISNKVKYILARRENTSLLLEVKLMLMDTLGLTRNTFDKYIKHFKRRVVGKVIPVVKVDPVLEMFHKMFQAAGVAPANYTNLDAGIIKGKVIKRVKGVGVKKVASVNSVIAMRKLLLNSVKSNILRDYALYMTSSYDYVEEAFDKNVKTL